jgi:hypothetical protein
MSLKIWTKALMSHKPLRFCVDYRKLNALTRKDRYPISLIGELLEQLFRTGIFTNLDIWPGFHRIRMEELTTFPRYGAHQYKGMPFGLTNVLAAF